MKPFNFHLPTRIVFGPGSIKRVGEEIKGIGKHAMIVIGKGSVKRLGYLEIVEKQLEKQGIKIDVFEGVETNPKVTTIDNGGRFARENGCDFIIALGGGSVMDASKGIACVAENGGSFWDYIKSSTNQNPKSFKKALPIVCIPTVAATGSEANCIAVVTNWKTKEKIAIHNPAMFPKVSIVDPSLTLSLPRDVTMYGGIDIFVHYLDPYLYTKNNNEISDGFSEVGMRIVMKYLPKVLKMPFDINGRCILSWASTIALSGFPNSGREIRFPLHAIEHEISARYDIPHGLGLGIILIEYMKQTYKTNIKRYEKFAGQVMNITYGSKKRKIMEGIKKLEEWLKGMGFNERLSFYNVDESELENMAESIIRLKGKNGYLHGIRGLDKNCIVKILRNCL